MTTRFRLQQVLDAYDVTQKALVEATGISPNTINRICKGHSQSVDLETLDGILAGLEALGVPSPTFNTILERDR